jgi:hypothetical protein
MQKMFVVQMKRTHLIIRNDFDAIILPNTDTGVGRAEVDPNPDGGLSFRGCHELDDLFASNAFALGYLS